MWHNIVFYSTLDRGYLLILKSRADTFFSWICYKIKSIIIKIVKKNQLLLLFYFRPANFTFLSQNLLSPRKIYFCPANFTFAPQIFFPRRKFYFRPAKFTFTPQILLLPRKFYFPPQMRFSGNICIFCPDFRGQKVAILVECGIKNIIWARPYKVRAKDKVTAAIRSAAVSEWKSLRAIRNVCQNS